MSVSEPDDELHTSVEDEASVTIAIDVGGDSDRVVREADQFSSVVIPQDDGDRLSFGICDIPNDVTVSIDATLGSAPFGSCIVVTTFAEPAGASFSRCHTSEDTTDGESSSESESFEVEHLFELVGLSGEG